MTYVNCIRVFLVIKITEKLSIGFVSLSSFSKLKDLWNYIFFIKFTEG